MLGNNDFALAISPAFHSLNATSEMKSLIGCVATVVVVNPFV